MIESTSVQDKFFSYLSTQMSSGWMSDAYFKLLDIEKFCLERGILNNKLFETTDLSVIRRVMQTVDSNRIFRFTYKRDLKIMSTAIHLYYKFLKTDLADENKQESEPLIQNETRSAIAVDIVEQNSNIKEPKQDIDQETARDLFVDFNNIQGMTGTKPLYFSYFESDQQPVDSWKMLYVKLMNILIDDYPYFLNVNKVTYFGKGRRIDYGTEDKVYLMDAPKKLENGCWIETHYNTMDILRKIRFVLDLCNVDFENVKICYTTAETAILIHATDDAAVKYPAIVSTAEKNVSTSESERQKFKDWMLRYEFSKDTITNNLSALDMCLKSVGNYKLSEASVHSMPSAEEFSRFYDQILSASELYNVDKQKYNRFREDFQNFIKYQSSGISARIPFQQTTYFAVPKISTQKTDNDSALNRYKELLSKFFSKGFRMDSSIDMRKFRKFYQEQYKIELSDVDSLVRSNIDSIAILYKGKAYLPDSMFSSEKKEKLLRYIQNKFNSECDAIYYGALFKEFEEDFLGEHIYTPEMLKTYLSYINQGNFILQPNYIAKDNTVQMDPEDEIKEYLKKADSPVEMGQVLKDLSYISRENIESVLKHNSEFIRNKNGEYFYEGCIQFDNSELEWVSQFVENGIEERGFVTCKELLDAVYVRFPDLQEMYQQVTRSGMQNVIKYKLKESFSIKGNIFSKHGEELSRGEVYAKYCQKRPRFTLGELKVLQEETGLYISFDEVYDNSLRISENEFVSQNMAHFDVEATDNALSRICTEQYMSLQGVHDFGTFPYAGFPWNEYLLEHFVAKYSKKFKLFHIGYNEKKCAGAIVKQTARYKDFNELLIDILANSNIMLDEYSALEYLYQQGYIARRRYQNIGRILTEAKVVRPKKG